MRIFKAWKVFQADHNGNCVGTIGYYSSEENALIVESQSTEYEYTGNCAVSIADVDGKLYALVRDNPITLDDALLTESKEDIKKKALAKLSNTERKVLGLE